MNFTPDYVVEANVHTIINSILCKIRENVDDYINGRRFGAQAFISAGFCTCSRFMCG